MNCYRMMLILLVAVCVIFNPLAVSAESNFDLLFKSSSQYKDVKVQDVIGVDTIVIESYLKGGEPIKLIGLKGPKSEIKKRHEEIRRDRFGFVIKDEEPLETPIEEAAVKYVRDLLIGKSVRIEFDTNKRNDDHQTVAYVFLNENDLFVNHEILRQGYALLSLSPLNTKYSDKLREAYKEARAEKRGFQGE